MKNTELTDIATPEFPFRAMMRGQERDYRRTDTPILVTGRFGLERHYYRCQLPNGMHVPVSDSMIYLEGG